MAALPHQRPPHPPLAHDVRGLPIAVPDGAAGWRIKRQTAGRPKVVLGPDRQPLRLPLDATAADLLDLCGAGTFRVDAIDEAGQPIDFVTTVTIGLDGAEPSESDPLPTIIAPRAAAGSELRYALEVTAYMARAQSEALRSIAGAQADFIKGLASAKALPRNGASWYPPPPMPPRAEAGTDEAEEEADDDDEQAAPDPSITLLGHIASIARDVSPVLQAVLPKKAADSAEHRNAAPTAEADEQIAPAVDVATPSIRIAMVLAELSPKARALACRVLAQNDERARAIATALQTLPVAEAVAQLEAGLASRDAARRGPREPGAPARAADPMAHLAAVMSRLAPGEIARAQALLGTLDAASLERLKAELLTMSPDEAAAFVRRALAEQAGGNDAGA